MKNRIVHIVKATGIHGTEKHLLTLLSGLDQKYGIFLIVLTEPGIPLKSYFDQLDKKEIPAYKVSIRSDMDLTCLWQIYKILKKINPSLVHTHLVHGDVYGTIAAKMAGVKRIVSTKHNDDQFRQNRLIKALNTAINKRTSGIIAISDWIRKFITKTEAVPLEKSRTIYYGLNDILYASERPAIRSELGLSEDTIVLGIIARLVKQKGHKYLIEAFGRVCKVKRGLCLLIAGDGELKNELEQQVKEAGLEASVLFTGYRPDSEKILSAVDIFVHPSLWEGFGLSILEAMAMGKPVISTRVSAIPELVQENETGFLVLPKDPDQLAQKILELCENKELGNKLGEKGRERWKKMFSVAKMVSETEKFYDELLADRS